MPGPGTWAAGDILAAADLNAIGTWSSYTPTVAQNGNRTITVNYAQYCQINKLCVVNLDVTVTNAGTTANLVTISLPINTPTTNPTRSVGSGFLYDASATDIILVNVRYNSTSTVRLVTETSTSDTSGVGVNPAFALANGDVISLTMIYETI